MLKDARPLAEFGFELATTDLAPEDILVPALDALWAESTGDPEISVAVLDGPVDTSHACFQGAHLNSVETLASDVIDSGPATVHGTHVASILFGQHGSPVRGISPGCRGLIVPVFRSGAGGGIAPCSQIDLARAITSAVQAGAHVINISGGQLSDSEEAHPLLENAVQHCAESGVLIVAAVGNDGCQCLHVPAAMSSVLAVGASDARGVPLDISNWGEAYHGVLAPGENIAGAVPGGGIARQSGTSFATPIVSGVAALLLSLQLKQGEKPDPHAVREAILASATPCDPEIVSDCPRFLAGQLNVKGALAIIKKTTQDNQGSVSTSKNHGNELTPTDKERVTIMNEPNQLEAGQDASPSSSPEHSNPEAGGPSIAGLPSHPSPVEATVPSQTSPSSPSGSFNTLAGPAGLVPSANGGKPPLVYAIGALSFDFGNEARHDAIAQAMGVPVFDTKQLLDYLGDKKYPWNVQAVTWTLEFDGTAVYAIQPQGPFAELTYSKLVTYKLRTIDNGNNAGGKQSSDKITTADRISVGGIIAGQTRLRNGQIVPVIVPEPRSLFDWNMKKLVEKVAEAEGAGGPAKKAAKKVPGKPLSDVEERSRGFLDRIYYELRNLGLTPQERALNFGTTKAYEKMQKIFVEPSRAGLELDRIDVEQSPVCRPQSDCWDVKLTFFNPKKPIEEAKRAYRFTVDVSEVIPVTIGELRQWSEFSK